MTDLPPDPLDELASAHLDGETTPDEQARLAADPGLQARVEALRAVRAAVGAVPASSEEDRASTVAAVLARLDEGATVTPLAPVHRGGAARGWRIAAVAAAVAAVALLIPLLARQDDSSTQDASGAGTEESTAADVAAPEAAGDASSGGVAAGAADSPPPSTTLDQQRSFAALADLGDFASVAALEAALDGPRETTLDGSDDRSAYGEAAPAPCDAETAAKQTTVREARARIDGRPVLVVVYDGGARLLVLDADSCAVVADVER